MSDWRPFEPSRDALQATRKFCTNFAPAGFYRHWREWHRGHGCELDDGEPPPADGYFQRDRHR